MFYKWVFMDEGQWKGLWVNTGTVAYGAKPADTRFVRWLRPEETPRIGRYHV